ncbi:MAG: PorV/PorQ family protein [Candidatus Delongbacteria bacterium]|nr:PorV/PorQ family protein [Candidatus Delongbacteria bacterium]
MKSNYKVIGTIVLMVLLVLALSPIYGGDADRVGTSSGTQVLIPVGARDLAMGGANLASTSGLEAIYWNPAGLSSIESGGSAMFSTMNTLYDIRVNYFAVGTKIMNLGVLGLDIKTLSFGDIPLTTNQDYDGKSGRTFSPTYVTAGITFSKKLTDIIQVGMATKLVYESVPRASASALAFDIGIQYHTFAGMPGLSLGIVVRNIGTDMEYSGSALLEKRDGVGVGEGPQFVSRQVMSSSLPASVEFGFTYNRQVLAHSDLSVTSMFQNNNYEHDLIKLGGEYTYNKLVSLRAGYYMPTGGDSEEYDFSFTAGGGIQLKMGASQLFFDYAFRSSQYFDANHVFCFKVGF